MTALQAGGSEVIVLPPYSAISITVSGIGFGSITRLGNNPGEASFGVADVTADTTIGPFAVTTRHILQCVQPALSYQVAPMDFPAVTSDIERIVKLSQAEYDDLTPDPATLYLIVG
jgi:hypothetical protein